MPVPDFSLQRLFTFINAQMDLESSTEGCSATSPWWLMGPWRCSCFLLSAKYFSLLLGDRWFSIVWLSWNMALRVGSNQVYKAKVLGLSGGHTHHGHGKRQDRAADQKRRISSILTAFELSDSGLTWRISFWYCHMKRQTQSGQRCVYARWTKSSPVMWLVVAALWRAWEQGKQSKASPSVFPCSVSQRWYM